MKSLLCMNAFSEIIELNLVTATFVIFILLLEFGAKKYALTILYGEYPIEEVFSDLCNEPLGEDFINDLAEKKDFCDEYVNYSCGGSCDELDYYLDAWKYIIDHIISGQITESTLDSWLEYFDECYYQEETTVEK